jgi:hypothetical protein
VKFWIPWLASFFFGLCIFLVGKYLQKIEKKRRQDAKAAGAKAAMYYRGEAARSALHELRQDEFFPEELGRYPGGEGFRPGAQPGNVGLRTH